MFLRHFLFVVSVPLFVVSVPPYHVHMYSILYTCTYTQSTGTTMYMWNIQVQVQVIMTIRGLHDNISDGKKERTKERQTPEAMKK